MYVIPALKLAQIVNASWRRAWRQELLIMLIVTYHHAVPQRLGYAKVPGFAVALSNKRQVT